MTIYALTNALLATKVMTRVVFVSTTFRRSTGCMLNMAASFISIITQSFKPALNAMKAARHALIKGHLSATLAMLATI